jgi:acyl-CoA synthetase (AMP-forming)/AMP-acid ligase II
MPPSTSDYIRFHARHTPRAVVVIEEGREIDFATLHRDLGNLTRAVRDFALPRGSTVAVAYEGLYLHWLLLLACENLGWASVSFLPAETDTLSQLFERVQLVLGKRPVPSAAGGKFRRLTEKWLSLVFSSPATVDAAGPGLGLDDTQRIRRSSGTTGGFKMMVTTRAVEEQRVMNHLLAHGFTPQSRLLVSTPFTVGSMYSRATGCLRLGATCISGGLDLARDIAAYRPTHVRLFQFQMNVLFAKLPATFRKPPDLTVMVGAAPLSEITRQKLMERLASRIVYTYSSNETGSIAVVDDGGVYVPRPGVELQIVDGEGAPVPAGEVGEVRVKTPGMVEGYLDDPARTAQRFRDGWFHTGDAGTVVAPGKFKLAGRTDELLNLGGRKIAPAAIEALVERNVPVEDIGVTSVADRDGVEVICIAVVLKERAGVREALLRIGKCLPKDFDGARLKAVTHIPRTTGTGKVRRAELKKLFAAK